MKSEPGQMLLPVVNEAGSAVASVGQVKDWAGRVKASLVRANQRRDQVWADIEAYTEMAIAAERGESIARGQGGGK